ncbi:PTS transporter subunit EIIC [Lactobacillus sp. ESL0684]|uniref:PTS sugar transporter subunit IIC n=1 Tax=unclassified Lactobacillus TaxID=2620435 RepID=UPI0023F650DC|nr:MULTISPECIES: PTS transporter subunit EIIC [unclassified Lactobacillus]WEV40211.1 PTS transporter subunit EIIC [Lactobacillus sp. ESL0681]WEV43264.1 PTS transporter subunit EIIC [Lactobacillus sp. ESL0684]
MKFNSEKISSVMAAIAGNRYMSAISNGMAVIIPVSIASSIFTLIAQIPLPFIKQNIAAFQLPVTFSIGLMGLYACYSIASHLAKSYKLDRNSSSTIAVMVYLMLTITPGTITPEIAKKTGIAAGTVFPAQNFGSYGLFTAMFAAAASVWVIHFFKEKNLVIKMPDGMPPAVSSAFTSLIPASVLIIAAWLIKAGLHFDLNQALLDLLSPLAQFGKDNLISVLVPIFFNSLFWLFGVHGAITSTPVYPFWYQHLNANMAAVTHGATAATVPHFMTEQLLQFFVYIGGAGSILALCILMAFFSKSEMGKAMGKVVLIPSIFNISEPVMFGIPIVLNPYFAAPFILAPMADGLITWAATVTGLLNKTTAIVPWVLPGPIGAFFATGYDWRAIVVGIINILVSMLIYLPFFKMWDRHQIKVEAETEAEEVAAA